jgi:SPP1 gp7 family putative phage head morphogenesis protein
MTEEQRIIHLRFTLMRSKLDVFEDKALKVMLGSYKQSIKELMREINNLSLVGDSFSLRRAEALLDETLLATDVINKRLTNDIAGMSAEAGVYSYREINKITSWDGLVNNFNHVSLSSAQLNAYFLTVPVGGHILSDWVNRTFKGSIDSIKQELGAGFLKGEGYSKLVKRLTSEFGMLERDATTLARSYIQEANVKAATDIYEANADVVKKVEWTAIMEQGNTKTGRGTCPRCQALDGRQWATKDRGRPFCPLHARCRCMLLPVTMTWRELGFDNDELEPIKKAWVIRADKPINIGGVPIIDYGFIDTNYAGWWKTRSLAFQNNAIGPRRADLIRAGKVDFGDLVVHDKAYLNSLNLRSKKKYVLGDQVLLDDLYKRSGGVPPIPKIKPKPKVPKKKILPVSKAIDSMPSLEDIGKVMATQSQIKKVNKRLNAIEEGLEKQRKKYLNSLPSERNSLYSSIVELNKQKKLLLSQLTIKNMPDVEAILKPPKGGKIDWKIGGVGKTAINKNKSEWNRIIRDAEDMYHPEVLKKLSSILLSRRKNSRARYTSRNKTILMGNEDTGVFIHEFSHHLEHDSSLYNKAKGFLSSRTVGEMKTRIYNAEYGWKDKFFNHYCGKHYSHEATEIISMGVQRMYENPFDFYDTDKEYFEFILKIMWGES